MKLWNRPSHYFGAEWPDYYVFLGQNRDSDSLTRSNFRCALQMLGGESCFEYEEGHPLYDTMKVGVIREFHFLCGWVEWIAIHKDALRELETAGQIERRLEDYLVVNESDWSDLEWTEAMDYWESMPISERVDYCRDCGVSIFAARRNSDLPDSVYESLRG